MVWKGWLIWIFTFCPGNKVLKPDLADEQKQWLIVGICLHSVISPALRQYIPKTVGQLYNNFVLNHQINVQDFQNVKTHHKSKELNYESINNNQAVPKINRQPDISKYDYAVKCDVDFSKLFLPTNLTRYSGFDSSCDISALLGIIINMDFPTPLQKVAEQVRRVIRNPWAHCNLSEWDKRKYQNSFQLMNQLVKNLKLPPAVLGELITWQTNGIQFLHGTTIGLELLKTLKTETYALSKYLLEVDAHVDESFEKCYKAFVEIEETLNATLNMVNELKKENVKVKSIVENLSVDVGQLQISQTVSNKDITILQAKTKDFENQQLVERQNMDKLKADLGSLRADQTEASDDINEIKGKILYDRKDIKDIKIDVEKNYSEINETKSRCKQNESDILQTKKEVMKNRDDISKLSQNLTCPPQLRNEFFFVPDRVSSFFAREEEIMRIEKGFNGMANFQHTQVICGLGGIGKTTLAVEFAWLKQTCYPAGVVWMSAESNDALEDSIQRLSIQIDKMGADNKETLHKVLNWLSLLPDQWLLIIDNVDVAELCGAVKELVHGSWKRSSKGHVIITSRRKSSEAESDFYVKSAQCITLDVLTASESKNFMISRSGSIDDENDKSLDKLVSELGGLPLALEQASAHIKALKCTYQNYLEKFERKRLKFLQKSKSPIDVTPERRTVLTTWHLNFDLIAEQSKDEGLGTAGVTAMKVSAYLYADDIPLIIFNVGSPKICDEDIRDCLQEEVGANQISAILSRFSLFQETGSNTLSVHRLVQEVIREDITDANEKKFVIECAVRMVNKALESTHSPTDAIKEMHLGRTSLLLWSKLCLHANTVQKHLFDFVQKNAKYNDICFNIETSRLLQSSSIYHSLNQRQDEALACQDQMLMILPALDISETALRDFTCIKIPLLNNDRLIIQGQVITNVSSPEASNTDVLLDPETLRIEGNNAFKLHKYHTAIQYYSEAIRVSDRADLRILSNRSLAYLKVCDFENALKDADRCIGEYQDNVSAKKNEAIVHKAYLWKAYAIANLIRLEHLPKCYESVGIASLAVAGHLNSQCLLELRTKIEYPVVRFRIIKSEKELAENISSIHNMVYTTLLLRKGHYEMPSITNLKSVQVIGIEAGVEIFHPLAIYLMRPKKLSFDIKVGPELNIHFENISFPKESGQVFVGEYVNATFYRCKFSNGRKACEDFPLCKGNVGCVNTSPKICQQMYMSQEKDWTERIVCGVSGSSGLAHKGKGRVVVDACIFDRCGGGGTCCIGEGAIMVIKHSTLRNMRQTGVEARYGGTVEVDSCTITNNQFHGVAIGPGGFGEVKNCIIRGNYEEGIYCGTIATAVFEKESVHLIPNPNGDSVCIIKGNIVSQNGLSGLVFDGGCYEVSGNRIFENWLWGIIVKSRSAANISNNDIFENKCGGIMIGINYSAHVIIDGNTIRDHTGQAVHVGGTSLRLSQILGNKYSVEGENLLQGELEMYSLAPFITTRNVLVNNDKGQLQPTEYLVPVHKCCYCHKISKNLMKCGKCKKATYCSKDCQISHWKRHKHMCSILYSSYTIEIEMSKTVNCLREYYGFNEHVLNIRTTTSRLPDLGKGTPPNRRSSKKFIVMIDSGKEYSRYNPTKYIGIYDQTQTVNFKVRHPELYHLACECGVLAGTKFTTKKIYCWAYFKDKGSRICIQTDNLPPFQTRW